MRPVIPIALFVLASVNGASAQSASRFELGPVVRVDKIFIEGDTTSSTVVAGAVGTFKLSKTYAVEVEVTQGSSGGFEHSREGWFISYVTTANPTREETERMAPTVLISNGYKPGMGWAAAFTARSETIRRVSLAARVGLSGRDYVESETYRILRYPDGVDPRRVERDYQNKSYHRGRGGLLLGLDASIRLTSHLSVAPEVRIVYGGPAQIGDKYREFGMGVRGAWRF